MYYDFPITKDTLNFTDLWMEKVTLPISRTVYFKSNQKIGNVIINSDKIREFFNIDDIKDIGFTDEEIELIR